jgi:protein associated with RNAse G/E
LTLDEPIGKPTPIHVTKYDGSYHRRWPVYYVAKRGPLYLAQGRAGEPVHATPDPADDPHPAPITWDSDVYLYDDRWYSVIRARHDDMDSPSPKGRGRGLGARIQYYANIGTPVEFDGASFHCVDLDLDVSWFTDDAPQVLDEDEFLAHSKAMRYPADVIERARSAVDDVLRLIKERAFPFDRA